MVLKGIVSKVVEEQAGRKDSVTVGGFVMFVWWCVLFQKLRMKMITIFMQFNMK